ncbi:MAG: class I SAM-dependent methyltransferase, partial [Planctomycetes bacterium]|nr:class I SAM-dependent methyltransferase [Planctomycetota bacterium]
GSGGIPAAPPLQASAAALPFAADSFDLVFCFRLLHHFAQPAERQAVLAELARVSRRWALVSYFDAASFQAWRHRVRGRRTVRFAQSNRAFDQESAAAGFAPRRRLWVARGISEQVLALLERGS